METIIQTYLEIPLSKLTRQEMRTMPEVMRSTANDIVNEVMILAFHQAIETTLENKHQAYCTANTMSHAEMDVLAGAYFKEKKRYNKMIRNIKKNYMEDIK